MKFNLYSCVMEIIKASLTPLTEEILLSNVTGLWIAMVLQFKSTVEYLFLGFKHPINQWAGLTGDCCGTQHLVKSSGAAATAPPALF